MRQAIRGWCRRITGSNVPSGRLSPVSARLPAKEHGPLIQYTPQQSETWEGKNWRGMYDTRADVLGPDEAPLLINLMPSDPARGGPVYLRAGRQTLGNNPTAPQLGSGAHLVQWIGSVTFGTGSTRIIAVVDGEIWEVATDGTVTKRISTANLTSAGITLSSGPSGVHAAEFDGTLVLADHTGNRPFTWDGTAGSGLVSLTNAPASVKGLTVYYAKIFFIKNTNVPTIVWSEELQANTGYEAGGYNNAWELTQTSNKGLTAILGTNQGLYYGRLTSVGIIRGPVSSTFQTDGVHDSVYQGSGPDSFNLWQYVGDTLFWGDFRGHIYAYREGGDPVNIAAQVPRVFGYDTTQWQASNANALPVYGAGEEGLALAYPQLLVADSGNQRLYAEYGNGTGGRYTYVYDVETLKLLSLWSFGTSNDRALGVFPSQLRYAAMGLSVSNASYYIYTDDSGYVFRQMVEGMAGTPPGADFDHTGASVPVVGTLVGPPHGVSDKLERRFTQLDVVTDELPTNSISVGYLTSRAHKVALAPTPQVASSSSVPNTPFRMRRSFGLGRDAVGLWLRPIIKISGTTSTLAGRQPQQLFSYTLTGSVVSASPATP